MDQNTHNEMEMLQRQISAGLSPLNTFLKGMNMSQGANEHTLAQYLQKCQTNTAANLLAGMHLAEPQILDIKGVPYIITPSGSDITDLTELMDRPKRLTSSPVFREPKSFCDYVNQFNEGKKARIYADLVKKEFRACLDDHQPGVPSWRDHTASLELRLSPEWLDWLNIAKATAASPMDQQELAEFFESHIRQIAQPDAADLLSGIRNIQMSNNWKCVSVQREGGDIAFSMQRENSANTTIGANKTEAKIPARLTLAIMPFLCWKQYALKVMLTYRLKDEKISFTLKLLEVNELLDEVFVDIRKHVEKETAIEVLL